MLYLQVLELICYHGVGMIPDLSVLQSKIYRISVDLLSKINSGVGGGRKEGRKDHCRSCLFF